MKLSYDPRLDGLRAFAAIVVLAFHSKVPHLGGGFLGVDVFFVLSGFLITKSLVTEYQYNGGIIVVRFLFKRFLRLYPALLGLLVFYVILAPLLFPQYNVVDYLRDVVWSALYLSDYVRTFTTPLSILSHTWSLSAEMHFYVVWPIILGVLVRYNESRLKRATLLLWFAAIGWRWCNFVWLGDGWEVYYRVDTHCSGLILGSLVAMVKPVSAKYLGTLGIFIIIFCMFSYQWRTGATVLWGFSLAEIGAALVVISPPAWLRNSLLAWMGKLSYGFYLWHYPIIRVLRDLDSSWQFTFMVGLVLGVAFAAASYYIIEKPFLKIKSRVSWYRTTRGI